MLLINISENLTLKACRIIANIRAEEMANYLGITVDTLYKWEKGKSFPNLPQMRKIVDLFAEKGYALDINDINFFVQ